MKVALAPLLLAFLMALPSCERDAISFIEIEGELREAKAETSRLKQDVIKLKADLSIAQDRTKQLDNDVSNLRAETAHAVQQLGDLEVRFTDYRAEYRKSILSRAPGMTLPDFEACGVSYQKVTIRNLDSWDLSVQHQNGIARLALADLPADLQEFLAYDPAAGPRPASTTLVSNNVNVYVPTNPLPVAQPSAASVPLAPRAPIMAAPEPHCSSSSEKTSRGVGRVPASAIITQWDGGGGAGSSGRSKITGPSAPPPGYTPIGSSYKGNDMDKIYKKGSN